MTDTTDKLIEKLLSEALAARAGAGGGLRIPLTPEQVVLCRIYDKSLRIHQSEVGRRRNADKHYNLAMRQISIAAIYRSLNASYKDFPHSSRTTQKIICLMEDAGYKAGRDGPELTEALIRSDISKYAKKFY